MSHKDKDLNIKKTLLLIDDDPISGDILENILMNDFIVKRAFNGKEGLDILHKEYVDLVLLDFYMPVMNGKEVLEYRQHHTKLKKIPFIVITSEKQNEEECFHLGVNDFISKPYNNPEIIIARISRMIEIYEDRSIIKELKTDKLTGLYTVDFFKKYSTQYKSLHPHKDFDVLAINITHFHLINEIYGRTYANETLKHIAHCLKNYVNHHTGLASRVSGDEFLMLTLHKDNYEHLVDELNHNLSSLTNSSSIVHLRIGIYPKIDNDLDLDIIIGRAIQTADSIKLDLNKTVAIYDQKAQEKALFEEELVDAFEEAIQQKQFKIFYQPKYSIQGNKNTLSSAEALIRWMHPKHGMVSPGVFIPLFEQDGLIQKLDSYVIEEVARQQEEWYQKLGFYMPVSVNISRVSIFKPNLIDEILEACAKHHIPHDKYYIEITESAYAENTKEVIALTNRLKEEGFLIEIDDFGAGYSSLNVLTEVSFDVIKIDMKFIRYLDENEKNKDIVRLILELCKHFKVKSVAEGVEYESHYTFLKSVGCDIIQGYYFSKPLPENDFYMLMEKECK